AAAEDATEVLAVDEALAGLAAADAQAAELVKLRYFAGLSIPAAAEALHMSPRSADRLWAYARAWLRRALGGARTPPRHRAAPGRGKKQESWRDFVRDCAWRNGGLSWEALLRSCWHERAFSLPGPAGHRRPGRAAGLPGAGQHRRSGLAGASRATAE